MELDQFITQTLNAIVKGIKDSQDFAIEHGARINPYIDKWDHDKFPFTFYGREEGARAISKIDFDVAITISNEKEKGGEGGISVFSAKLGGKLSNKDIDETISRINFSVNVVLPNVKP